MKRCTEPIVLARFCSTPPPPLPPASARSWFSWSIRMPSSASPAHNIQLLGGVKFLPYSLQSLAGATQYMPLRYICAPSAANVTARYTRAVLLSCCSNARTHRKYYVLVDSFCGTHNRPYSAMGAIKQAAHKRACSRSAAASTIRALPDIAM